MTKAGMGSWSLKANEFPQKGSFEAQAKYLLRYTVLAPSSHNSQPWRFRIGAQSVDILADRSRALPVVDPLDRELIISCGAALATLEVAAQHFGFDPQIVMAPDPKNQDILAHVRLPKGNKDTYGALLPAILQRRTTRASFGPRTPSDAVMDACAHHAAQGGVYFSFFTDADTRKAVAELVDAGDHLQFSNPAFRRELASWVHSVGAGARDGMSASGFGMPDVLAPVARFALRRFDIGNGVAAGDVKKILNGTPMLALLSTDADNTGAWLQTGRALGLILLDLTAHGFTASFLNQPIECVELRPKLRDAVGAAGVPQILLRIGEATDKPSPSQRRALGDVLL
ncbi:MAG: Acg family FMN-binding oxidoreductase [Halocynthiibacter sp.]